MMHISELPVSVLIDGDIDTREVHIDGKHLRPDESQKIRNHSPDGFNWGYGGSGPAQLALAILMKFMSADDAQHYYQAFKFNVVASWNQGADFEVTLNLRKEIQKIQDSKSDDNG